uniref:Lysosomal membrane ascorbate-dependent ferrireductase CYB561A3 n=1 Tax=Oncorhynchus mykiss TaxID=8022 RepID=A0A8K9V5W5_ONCMY
MISSTVLFYGNYVLCLCLGLLCVVFVSYWNIEWRGGFAWDASFLQFNWHPVLMVTGLVVLYGNAAILYRIPFTWSQRKQHWKLVHAALLLSSLILSILGLCAVFDFHTGYHIPNLYSLHSWVGIFTVVLFTAQWLLGLVGFLSPCSPLGFRKLLKPVHAWMGMAIFILSLASCLSVTRNADPPPITTNYIAYSSHPAEALFANFLGVLIVAFGLVVLGILSNQRWKRPEPGEESSRVSILLSYLYNTWTSIYYL